MLPLVFLLILIPGIFNSMTLIYIGGAIGVATIILVIVWFATPGTGGANRFGDDPFGRSDADVFG